jgi:hypothetical protein
VDNKLFSNGVIQCNVPFVRTIQDWVVDLVLAFLVCYIHSDSVVIVHNNDE